MLKISEVGMFKCEMCYDCKEKKGVEIQTYGCRIQAPVVIHKQDGSKKLSTPGYRYVWHEHQYFCLDHLKDFFEKLIDNLELGDWDMIKFHNSMLSDNDVNITYEEALKKGVMRKDYVDPACEEAKKKARQKSHQ